jgi:hypothetical protein
MAFARCLCRSVFPTFNYPSRMADKDCDVQQTPTGYEIPVPEREDVFKFFRKVARPVAEDDAEDSAEGDGPSADEKP